MPSIFNYGFDTESSERSRLIAHLNNGGDIWTYAVCFDHKLMVRMLEDNYATVNDLILFSVALEAAIDWGKAVLKAFNKKNPCSTISAMDYAVHAGDQDLCDLLDPYDNDAHKNAKVENVEFHYPLHFTYGEMSPERFEAAYPRTRAFMKKNPPPSQIPVKTAGTRAQERLL